MVRKYAIDGTELEVKAEQVGANVYNVTVKEAGNLIFGWAHDEREAGELTDIKMEKYARLGLTEKRRKEDEGHDQS